MALIRCDDSQGGSFHWNEDEAPPEPEPTLEDLRRDRWEAIEADQAEARRERLEEARLRVFAAAVAMVRWSTFLDDEEV